MTASFNLRQWAPLLLYCCWLCATLLFVPPVIWHGHLNLQLLYPVIFLALLPVTFRPLYAALRYFLNAGFYLKKNGDMTDIHLSILALTGDRHCLIQHWADLIRLTSQVLQNGELICMSSHLLTPARIKKFIDRLPYENCRLSFSVTPRQTPLAERIFVPVIYLLSQWHLPPVHAAGATLRLSLNRKK